MLIVNKDKKRSSCPDPPFTAHQSLNSLDDCIMTATAKQPTDPRDWEDGPVFRATIAQLEAKTSSLKAAVKHILKAATASLRARQALLEADADFITALRETSYTQPLFRHYLDDASSRMQEQRQQLQHAIQTMLIDPLQKLYDHDVKQAEAKRRQFEDESKKYYASLSKYLGKKSNIKSDSKYLAKKCRFDMIRFDYITFLDDLHGGKKYTEFLYQLVNLHQKEQSFHATMSDILDTESSGLETLASLIEHASREHTAVFKERSEARRALEAEHRAAASSPTDSSHLSFSDHKPESLFHGIRDLQCFDHDLKSAAGRRKEGVLLATSRPLKVNDSDRPPTGVPWHKYWCVLSAGQLYEYSNWKRSLEAHMSPVNLRFATVRVARNTDRRFCFEVITPRFRRLYQAMSQEDMQIWITTINNAIESVLNGQGSALQLSEEQSDEEPTNFDRRPKSWVVGHRLNLGGALANLATTIDGKEKKRKLHRHSIGHAIMMPAKRHAPDTIHHSLSTLTLVDQMYKADVGNMQCADCGADKPDWCSLNLGIFLCIECSGIHRSLGSHISKVRSLTLDSNSFTPEVVNIFLAVGNTRANAIWHAKEHVSRPNASDPRDTKVNYVFLKYRDHALVGSHDIDDPQRLLFEAIETDDIPKALRAVALGANVNRPRQQQYRCDNDEDDEDEDDILFTPEAEEFITLPVLDADGHRIPNQNLRLPLPVVRNKLSVSRFPLQMALALDSLIMAEFLIQNGADPAATDPETGCKLTDLVLRSGAIDGRSRTYFNYKVQLLQADTHQKASTVSVL